MDVTNYRLIPVRRIVNYFLLLILFSSVLVPSIENVDLGFIQLRSLEPHDVLPVVVAMLLLGAASLGAKNVVHPGLGVRLAIAWTGWMWMSTLVNLAQLNDLLAAIKLTCFAILMFATSVSVKDHQTLEAYLRLYRLLGVIAASVAILQQLARVGVAYLIPFDQLIERLYPSPAGNLWSRPGSVFEGSPNALGSFLMATAMISIGLYLQDRKLMSLLAIFVQTAGLVVTRSNGSVLAMLVSVGWLIWSSRRKHVLILVLVLLVWLLAGFAVLDWIGPGLIERMLVFSSASADTRIVLWRTVLQHFAPTATSLVFGRGQLTTFFGYDEYGRRLGEFSLIDNGYLNLFVRYGIPGLLMFLAIMYSLYRSSAAVWRTERTKLGVTAMSLGGLLVGYLVQAFSGDWLPPAGKQGYSV
ncbi:MAG: O-antigen ligase family protein, partial [Bacillota bacterium]